MDAERFLELQKQMRQNNEEISDFLKDFGSWKADVERKDAKLHSKNDTDSDLPAVRNSLLKKHKKKTRQPPKPAEKSAKRISGYDYRSWDKFDVDEALAEIDQEDQERLGNGDQKEDTSSSETDEEMENKRRVALSKEARELGNLRFKEGKYLEAVEQYTSSIRLTPEDPVPLTNRAMANLKLERYASAEADCTAALQLNPNCIKALYRRAVSRKHLNKEPEAIQDLQTILRLDATNTAAVKELAHLSGQSDAQIRQQFITTKSSQPPTLAQGDVARRFRRIPIVEVGGGTMARDPSPCGPLPSTTRVATPLVSESKNMVHHQVNLHSGGPSNWFQMERELRELNATNNTRHSISDYLCAIPPDRYAQLIGNNLDSSFLIKLLRALNEKNDQSTPEQLFHSLEKLSALPRFDVAWMLADEADRRVAMLLIDRLRNDPTISFESAASVFDRFC